MNNKTIPVSRVIEKLDEHLNRDDYESALRHLLYWESEAEFLSDDRGLLTINCELMGLYRKISKKEEAYAAAKSALDLVEDLHLSGSVTSGTVYTNCATVYNAFGDNDLSVALFVKAEAVYEKELDNVDKKLGALYNNFGLTLCALKRYDEAEEKYFKAISVMERFKSGELDVAITHLNLANLYEARDGIEEAYMTIADCLQAARDILESDTIPRDSYYAFVCEKCANTFGYYGMEDYARELKERSKNIYERS